MLDLVEAINATLHTSDYSDDAKWIATTILIKTLHFHIEKMM